MVRVSFFAVYYILNCVFVAELFSIAITLPLFILCCINIGRIRTPNVTPSDMIWLIAYLFFVIGPCQAIDGAYIGKGRGPVSGITFSNDELLQASLIIFTFFSVVTLVLHLLDRTTIYRPAKSISIPTSEAAPLLMTTLVAFAAFVIFSGGLSNVLAARGERIRDEVSVISTFFLAVQMVSTLLLATIYKINRKQKLPTIAFFVSCIFLLISQNPFNAARYFLLASWLPVIFVMLNGRIAAVRFYSAVFFAIVFLMPIFSLTSRFGKTFADALQNVDIAETFFHLPYIDVFDMLAYEVKFLSTVDFTWGSKTLGMIFFFVPRSIWTTKPTILAQDMGLELVDAKIAGTANLSMFFAGEFFADAGLVGVALGALIVSALLVNLARRHTTLINGYDVRSFIFAAAVPILMRGPFGANAPLAFCEFLALAALSMVFARKNSQIGRTASISTKSPRLKAKSWGERSSAPSEK